MINKEVGVLCPLFSLPTKYGIGTLGKEAFDFVNFLHDCGVSMWQILPLNVTSYGNSPYQSPSNFGLNYNFIDLEILIDKKLLTKEEVESVKWTFDEGRIDYGAIFNNKLPILKIAYSRFDKTSTEFIEFVDSEEYFKDFALFMVIKDIHHLRPWYERNDEYKKYSKKLEEKVISEYKDEYYFYLWTQYEFMKQYNDLKKYANDNGIKMMGDLPIYVAFDSVEVWKYPELFELDQNHYPVNVAGCPPDCFSKDGQLWGNPLYNWEYHKKTNYHWWNQRIFNSLKLFDLIRIDHFRGFSAYYSIPFKDDTAKNGKWVAGPGIDLFKDKLDLNIVAEDLGMVDEAFEKLMKDTNYPGMKIVTQCFDNDDPENIRRPSNYTSNYFSYTGTHDSQTTKQYIECLDENQRNVMIRVLKDECEKLHVPFDENMSNEEITYKICEVNLASDSKMAVLPIMDLLTLGEEARINYPSKLSDKNWSWRFTKGQCKKSRNAIQSWLTECVKKYRR